MKLKKKSLLVLPVLVLPFTTLLFWALGGGTANANQTVVTTEGINTELPNANNKKLATDKMSFYDAARRDSLERMQALNLDPYNNAVEAGVEHQLYAAETLPQEAKLRATIGQVEKIINEPSAHRTTKMLYDENIKTSLSDSETSQSKDPELEQLSGMIDKILEIQHPEKVKEKYLLQSQQKAGSKTTTAFTTIAAVIPETQSLVSGAVIRIRLAAQLDVTDSVLLPAGAIMFGITALQGERLLVHIPSVRIRNRILPVNLQLYDSDGIDGIYIPGAITREVAKESGDDAINDIELGTLDPSLKAQAASAGIKAARSLLSRKIKLTRVVVPAGHQVYLQQKN
jgi:hypothetical protein